MKKALSIGLMVVLIVGLVAPTSAATVTYRDGDYVVTIDEENRTVHIEEYQSIFDKFLSFFSITSYTVQPTGTVKGNVKEFYKASKVNSWGAYTVFVNERSSMSSFSQTTGGPCLVFTRKYEYLTDAEKNAINTLNFQTYPIRHARSLDGGGTLYSSHVHIRYSGRELTADELWIPDIKQRAIEMGYDIRSNSQAIIGWGFYGATKQDAYNAYRDFVQKTGVSGSATRYSSGGGYIWAIGQCYASSLVSITDPYVTPTPTPMPTPIPDPPQSDAPNWYQRLINLWNWLTSLFLTITGSETVMMGQSINYTLSLQTIEVIDSDWQDGSYEVLWGGWAFVDEFKTIHNQGEWTEITGSYSTTASFVAPDTAGTYYFIAAIIKQEWQYQNGAWTKIAENEVEKEAKKITVTYSEPEEPEKPQWLEWLAYVCEWLINLFK